MSLKNRLNKFQNNSTISTKQISLNKSALMFIRKEFRILIIFLTFKNNKILMIMFSWSSILRSYLIKSSNWNFSKSAVNILKVA